MAGKADCDITPRGREMYGDPKVALRFSTAFVMLGLLLGALCFLLYALFASFCGVLGDETPSSLSGESASGAEISGFPVIVLDAGHGGEDGGASGHGCVEKELNLEVAKRLGEFLTLGGMKVVYTRTDDRMLYTDDTPGRRKNSDLRGRLDIASKYPGCVFVSIHMNTFPSEECSGTQVYYSKNDPLGKTLAQSIQSAVCGYLQTGNSRKIKAAGSNIYLLDRIESPAVLIECGFLSNSGDAALLSDPAYRIKLAMCVYQAISDVISPYNQQNTEVIAK